MDRRNSAIASLRNSQWRLRLGHFFPSPVAVRHGESAVYLTVEIRSNGGHAGPKAAANRRSKAFGHLHPHWGPRPTLLTDLTGCHHRKCDDSAPCI